MSLIERGDAIGYVEFPSNYTNYFIQRLLRRNFADNKTIDGSTIKSRWDLSGKETMNQE